MRQILLLSPLLLFSLFLSAQQIILDRPVRAGELTLFPDMNDQNKYYYVLDKARLATDENNKPKFSFLRYVDNVSGNNRAVSLTEATGGGIVHAMVTLEVTPDQLQEAERDLRRLNSTAQIEGPVIFKSGRFSLVTSFTADNGDLTRQLVGIGNAPILDGQKAAVSLFLTKLGSQLLWESFKTATPDISFSFEMTMEGFRLPKRAVIEADFEDIYKSFDAGLQLGMNTGGGTGGSTGGSPNGGARNQPGNSSGGNPTANPGNSADTRSGTNNRSPNSGFMIGAEIGYVFEELRKTGAIKVEQFGDDEDIDALVTTAYTKLADLMFDQIGANATNQQANPQQFLNQLTNSQQGNSTSPLNGVMVRFKMKEQRRTGKFRFDFNKWTNDEIMLRFDENVGNLTQYQNDPKVFRQFNLDDPLYQQREILAMIDGYNAEDFGTYINSVSVHMRKQHAKGHITDREVRIDRTNFNQTGNVFSMMYGWHDDTDRRKWMDYQYEVLWSFFGDVEVKQDLKPSTFNTINLAPPFQKYEVEIEADPTLLANQEVRMVTVKLFYMVAGKEFTKQATLVPSRNQLSQRLVYIASPADRTYEYEITWRLSGNRTVQSGRQRGTDTLLFADELPNSNN